ncbi:MAG: tyrosine-type recombinase/integrase, partial [Aureispira sp.]|nr:tyrosine-type recombinase/integrase [Aureispira sp.]
MAKKASEIGLITALKLSEELKRTYVRPKTAQEYKNHLERFEAYLIKNKLDKMKLTEFDRNQAIFYLDSVLIDRKVLTMTRNNYMRVMKALFGTLVEREYILINPFVGIPRLKETKKKRRTFTKEEKQVIIRYVKPNDKRLFLAICLCYYCAIRPVEMKRLKISNIDLKAGVIHMDGSQTKNKECATITIPKVLAPLLESLELENYPKHYYLFGAQNLEPNEKASGRDTISKRH